jgi:FMN phosphatase YigB (HAD superfamily)
MTDVSWLFFNLGCTLVDEEAAHERRLQRLVEALAHCGRRCSIDEARAALAAAWAEFASRPIIKAIEKLVDGAECRRAVLTAARYPKELEAPYAAAEPVLWALHGSYKLGVIANQSVGSTERLTRWGLMSFVSTCLCSFEFGVGKARPGDLQTGLGARRLCAFRGGDDRRAARQ